MDHGAIDAHKKESQICIAEEGGRLVEKRIASSRERLRAEFGKRPRMRILIEASTESEWVAQTLEELGHEVIVADPNYAPMYATRSRKVKTDRRDARALAEACRLGAYQPAHRTSAEQRHMRDLLAVRDALMKSRSQYIVLIRSLLRIRGLRVRTGSAENFLTRLPWSEMPVRLQESIRPLVQVLEEINRQLACNEKVVLQASKPNPVIRLLGTAPGVGVVTAVQFVATLDQVERFDNAHQVQAYVGLVPREMSSGEKQRRGGITKTGHRRTRAVLVQAAWSLWRSKDPASKPLRQWMERIAARRGKKIAAVAMARRLAGILYAMWRDGTEYQVELLGKRAKLQQAA
jgi:transposase